MYNFDINNYIYTTLAFTKYVPIERAKYVCVFGHSNQFRKDGKTPYYIHPYRVADYVNAYVHSTENMVAAAYLHDILEDTEITKETLERLFKEDIVKLVVELTNPSKGLDLPRSTRKAIDREHLKFVSWGAKIIKMFDRFDNISDLSGFSKDFTKLYMEETLLMLAVIEDADKKFADLIAEQAERILKTVA